MDLTKLTNQLIGAGGNSHVMVNYLGREYDLPNDIPQEFMTDCVLNVQTDIDAKNVLHLAFIDGILVSIEIWNLDRCITDLKLMAIGT